VLGATISAINITRDIVPIDLAKGILGTIANILDIVRVRSPKLRESFVGIPSGSVQSFIKNKSDFLAIIDKCETIRNILETTTVGVSESYLQGPFGKALSTLNK